MKIYLTIWLLTLLAGIVLDVDKDVLKIIMATGVATLFRLFYEINYNKIKLTFTRVAMIIIVSIFLPYALSQLINSIEVLEKIRLFTLFLVGALAIDLTEVIIKKIPQKISEVLDLIPEFIKGKLGIKNKEDETI